MTGITRFKGWFVKEGAYLGSVRLMGLAINQIANTMDVDLNDKDPSAIARACIIGGYSGLTFAALGLDITTFDPMFYQNGRKKGELKDPELKMQILGPIFHELTVTSYDGQIITDNPLGHKFVCEIADAVIAAVIQLEIEFAKSAITDQAAS